MHPNVRFYSTVEDDIIVNQVDSEVIDDFELGQDDVDIEDNDANEQKMRRCIRWYKVCLQCKVHRLHTQSLFFLVPS